MNKVILMGRLTRDPEIRYSQGDNSKAIALYSKIGYKVIGHLLEMHWTV